MVEAFLNLEVTNRQVRHDFGSVFRQAEMVEFALAIAQFTANEEADPRLHEQYVRRVAELSPLDWDFWISVAAAITLLLLTGNVLRKWRAKRRTLR